MWARFHNSLGSSIRLSDLEECNKRCTTRPNLILSAGRDWARETTDGRAVYVPVPGQVSVDVSVLAAAGKQQEDT